MSDRVIVDWGVQTALSERQHNNNNSFPTSQLQFCPRTPNDVGRLTPTNGCTLSLGMSSYDTLLWSTTEAGSAGDDKHLSQPAPSTIYPIGN